MSDDMKVWVGCLACYNEGRLVGEWLDALQAGEYVPCHRAGHEECWCFATDTPWITGECSPSEAQAIAEAIEALPDHLDRDAVLAYVSGVMGYEDVRALLRGVEPFDVSRFEDAYRGEFEITREYTDELFDDLYAHELTDSLRNYIDYEAWNRDVMMDHTAVSVGGKLYIFDDTV